MSGLRIIRASAGSGKTFSIVRHYLSLALQSNEVGYTNFRHILAITFTNKATEEMKSRIVGELVILARGEESDHAEPLAQLLKLTDKQLQHRADQVLKHILHDYSRFAISTVDSFFQRILRGYTKELNLNPNFAEEIQTDEIAEAAIDEMLVNLEENSATTKHLVKFSQANLIEGKSWNIKNNLIGFANSLFGHEFLSLEQDEKSNTKEQQDSPTKVIYKVLNGYKKTQANICQTAIDLLRDADLELDDFKGKQRSAPPKAFFASLQDYRKQLTDAQLKAPYDIDKWATAKSPKRALIESLLPQLSDGLLSLHETNQKIFFALAIAQNIHQVEIIQEIKHYIGEVLRQRNSFPLAYTPKLLRTLTSASTSPFIYEKIGTYFQHFMVDEFQDTSKIQWDNLWPLVEESIATGNSTVVVGDIKQAIYRFRGGDWKLMSRLIEQFPQNVEVLEHNWRSFGQVIQFNNELYTLGVEKLTDFLTEIDDLSPKLIANVANIYEKQAQKIPSGKEDKGRVLTRGFRVSKGTPKMPDYVAEQLCTDIAEHKAAGYEYRDMAILMRNGTVEKSITDLLSEHKIPFLSEKSLFLSQSTVVKLLVSSLRYSLEPKSTVYRESVLHQAEVLDITLPEDYFEELASLNDGNFARIEKLVSKLQLQHTLEGATYLDSFLNLAYEFSINQNASVSYFLEFWDTTGHEKKLMAPESQNAVRLVTVHKSKGLEYKVVFIPYCNWKLIDNKGNKADTRWVKLANEDFQGLGTIPITFTDGIRNTELKETYDQETVQACVEALNCLYVGTTRARESLVLYYEFGKEKPNTVSYLIESLVRQKHPDLETTEEDKIVHTIGSLPANDTYKDEVQSNSASTESKTAILNQKLTQYRSFDLPLASTLKTRQELSRNNEQLISGSVLHELLSKVYYLPELEKTCDTYIQKGELTDALKKELIDKIHAKPELVGWFSEQYEVRTEASILSPSLEEKRPDRVLINENQAIILDFKFGMSHKSHQKQVQHYKELLEQMGYPKVEAYLWYFANNEIVAV